jgi:hypothetical protein
MAEWLKGCEVCNAGLCARFDELIGQGMSQRQAAKELEKDQEEELGEVVYSAQALRRRLQHNRVAQNGPPQESGRNSSSEAMGGTNRATPKPPPEYPDYMEAVDLATIAISQLSRIRDNDPYREKGFQMVLDWLTEKQKGRKL